MFLSLSLPLQNQEKHFFKKSARVMEWYFFEIRLQKLGFHIACPLQLSLLLTEEARFHVVSRLMETPTWQGTKSSRSPSAHEKLSSANSHTVSLKGNPPPAQLQMSVKSPRTLGCSVRETSTQEPGERHHDSRPTGAERW